MMTPLLAAALLFAADAAAKDEKAVKEVKDEHAFIGVPGLANIEEIHTQHPDAQWFPDARLGLFNPERGVEAPGGAPAGWRPPGACLRRRNPDNQAASRQENQAG